MARWWWWVGVAGCSRYDHILALTGDPVEGEALYRADCVSCHGVDGVSATAPSLPEVLPARTGEEILRAIDEGPGVMPEYRPVYDAQQMADLLEYLTLEFQ
ncbi:MAG: cytochrome c [Myxococcota bacterium]